jgi:hypothetical protein
MSPPVDVLIPHTVTVSFQAVSSIGSIGTLWQPLSWATLKAVWTGLGGYPQSKIMGLREYRTYGGSGTPPTNNVSLTAGSLDTNGGTCMGQTMFGGSSAVITVSGGPPDPYGSTWTVEASLEPAFQDEDGTQWYRKTVVTVTPPELDSIASLLS